MAVKITRVFVREYMVDEADVNAESSKSEAVAAEELHDAVDNNDGSYKMLWSTGTWGV